jgi:hypothetical protein
VLSYAPAAGPRDVVAAALAEAAQPQGDMSTDFDDEVDPIAQRINAATEVALASSMPAASGGVDPTARLTELARLRAGKSEIIAGAAAVERGSGEAGWHIQIGAVPTEAGAEALIERAQQSMGQMLASLVPVTQPVEHEGETLFRARFAGFAGKEEARAACAKLKGKSFACLAVPN